MLKLQKKSSRGDFYFKLSPDEGALLVMHTSLFSKEDIEYIEFKTREIISLISPEIVYFSVSHSDQDSFHIHRIIKK